MNNKGQSLVLFVLILPIIIIIFAFFIDIGLAYYNKAQINGTIESNLEIILKKKIYNQEKIESVIKENIDDCTIDIKNNNNRIYLKITKKNNYIFKHLLIEKEDIELFYCGDYNTGLISFSKECL